MHEPSPRTSRLVVASAAMAVVLLGGGGFLLGRSTVPEIPLTVAVQPLAPTVTPAPAEKPVARVLGRADITGIANAAADAVSSGQTQPQSVSGAEAQRFEIYLPFGCEGPAPEDSSAPLRWRYDAETSSLRISVAPVTFDPGEWLHEQLPGRSGAEPPATNAAVEGFWILRPWSSRETCERGAAPAAPLGIDAVTLPGQTLGLAQIFTDEHSRNAVRNGKPYESVTRVDEKDLKIKQGLRLRLRGRTSRFPNGAVVKCRQPAGPEQRPVCLVAVTFDDVSIENPATQETIATWASASRT
jgi:hypothetical protein